MVIYLHRKNKLLINLIIFISVVGLIIGSGYIISYLKYNDYGLVELETLKVQNKLLQDELDSIENLKTIKEDYIIGKVIIRNIHEFYNEIVIDLGYDNQIKEGDAVLNSEGLIGIVYKVERNKSYIKLSSSDYNISVKINDTYGNLSAGKITMLNKYSELKEGDKVYTSNYSGLPENIYIGEIESISFDNENLGQTAKIKLIDNHNLNYVAVIVGAKWYTSDLS